MAYDEVLCSMKLSAMLTRHKGRDFYDAMFLLAQIKPNFSYLAEKFGIRNLEELKTATNKMLTTVDLNIKKETLNICCSVKGTANVFFPSDSSSTN